MNKIIYGAMSLFPVLAFAGGAQGTLGNITELVRGVANILELLIPMAFALALIYFFYGVAKYISSAGDPKKADEGKSIMIYGVIAIAVMASVYGLVAYLQSTFNVDAGGSIDLPTVDFTI